MPDWKHPSQLLALQSLQVFSTKPLCLSSTNHKSNIDKLVRSERHYKSQQLILKVFFLPSVRTRRLCQRGRLPPLVVVPVQEQLVWGLGRAGVWHSDYRWFCGWGKLRFCAAYLRNPLWASPHSWGEEVWLNYLPWGGSERVPGLSPGEAAQSCREPLKVWVDFSWMDGRILDLVCKIA